VEKHRFKAYNFKLLISKIRIKDLNKRWIGYSARTYIYYFIIYVFILIWGIIYMYKSIKQPLIGFETLIFMD